MHAGIETAPEMCTVPYSTICKFLPGIRAVSLTSGHSVPSQLVPPARPETSEAAGRREHTGLLYDPAPDISHTPQCGYSSGQNKVPTAEWKSRLIVAQYLFDSRSIVAQWKIVSAYAPLQSLKLRAHLHFPQHPPLFTSTRHCCFLGPTVC